MTTFIGNQDTTIPLLKELTREALSPAATTLTYFQFESFVDNDPKYEHDVILNPLGPTQAVIELRTRHLWYSNFCISIILDLESGSNYVLRDPLDKFILCHDLYLTGNGSGQPSGCYRWNFENNQPELLIETKEDCTNIAAAKGHLVYNQDYHQEVYNLATKTILKICAPIRTTRFYSNKNSSILILDAILGGGRFAYSLNTSKSQPFDPFTQIIHDDKVKPKPEKKGFNLLQRVFASEYLL